MVNLKIFIILDYLLPVQRHATDFYIVMLYPANALNSLISLRCFFCQFHRILFIQNPVIYE